MVKPTRPPANAFVAAARKVYNPLGFSRGYNFIYWFICCGALMGFVLARFPYLNFSKYYCNFNNHNQALSELPGECYHFTKRLGKIGILLHLGAILPAGFLVVFQFVPAIRHKWIIVHRINGYIIMLLSLVSTAGVFMLARNSFGGGPLGMQTAVGVAAIIFLGSMGIAYYNIKRLQIEQHRAWMIRGWGIGAFIITMRIIGVIMSVIVTAKPSGYYLAQPCDVIDYTFQHNQTRVLDRYPTCSNYYSGKNPNEMVAVMANMAGGDDQLASSLMLSFAGSGWLAIFIHIVMVELYLHLTPAEAERLRKYSYERQLAAGMKNPGNAGLTAQKLGDAEPWLNPDERNANTAQRRSDSLNDSDGPPKPERTGV